MSTTTIAQYRLYTADDTTASAAVQANLDVAEELVEDYLRRELAEQERTERVRWSTTCRVFPKHIPITSVAASATYTVENEATLANVGADTVTQAVGGPSFYYTGVPDDYRHNAPYAEVTYTGGWTADTIPATIARQVSLVAQAIGTPSALNQPGVSSASVGDVSITKSAAAVDAEAAAIDSLVPLSSAVLRAYRYRPF